MPTITGKNFSFNENQRNLTGKIFHWDLCAQILSKNPVFWKLLGTEEKVMYYIFKIPKYITILKINNSNLFYSLYKDIYEDLVWYKSQRVRLAD